MRRIVLGAEDGKIGDGRVTYGTDAGMTTLLLPETRAEYEKARAEVESLAGDAGRSVAGRPADTNGTIDTNDTNGTITMPGAGCWVVTTGEQRRAWGLPDLDGVASVPVRARDDLQRAWNGDAVPLVDADDAVRLLADNDADRQTDDGDDDDTYGANGTRALGPVRPEHAASEFVNLKHGRGPIPVQVRETFDELSGRSRIDALVDSLDEVLGPLEHESLPLLEETRREVGALRPLLQRELARRSGCTRPGTPDRGPAARSTSGAGSIRCCVAYAGSPPHSSCSTRPCCPTARCPRPRSCSSSSTPTTACSTPRS